MIVRWRDPWGKECSIAAAIFPHPIRFIRLVRAAKDYSLLHQIDRERDLEQYQSYIKRLAGRGKRVELRVTPPRTSRLS